MSEQGIEAPIVIFADPILWDMARLRYEININHKLVTNKTTDGRSFHQLSWIEQEEWMKTVPAVARINREIHNTGPREYRVKLGTINYNHQTFGPLVIHYWRTPDSDTAYITKVYKWCNTSQLETANWLSLDPYEVMANFHDMSLILDYVTGKHLFLAGIYTW